jgi:hypothetical protein
MAEPFRMWVEVILAVLPGESDSIKSSPETLDAPGGEKFPRTGHRAEVVGRREKKKVRSAKREEKQRSCGAASRRAGTLRTGF